MDWEYLDMSKQFRSEFVPRGDNTYELVVVVSLSSLVAHQYNRSRLFHPVLQADDVWRPAVINTKVDDKDAYATQDLFIPHESRPGLWKIFGRADDQIMLSTGEKVGLRTTYFLEVVRSSKHQTNPGPLGELAGSTL